MEKQLCDIDVIPDKYNTGCRGELTTVVLNGNYGGITFYGSLDLLTIYFNKNMSMPDNCLIENCDFSNFPRVNVINESAITSFKTITFRNCKFSAFNSCQKPFLGQFIFEYCTLQGISACNIIADHCYIGGSYSDALNPISNSTFQNCYISDLSKFHATLATHTDGIQTYGATNSDIFNIRLYNCRFEMPFIPMTGSVTAMSSVFFICPERANGSDIRIENCIINGAGNSIHVGVKAGSQYTLDSQTTILKDIKVGYARTYSVFYPNQENNAQYINITNTDSLYVASVWKENGLIHISVSNDTPNPRYLIVSTNNGVYVTQIKACYQSSKITGADNLTFADYPFDIDITVADADYVVCYDYSYTQGCTDGLTRIRYVNFNE